MKLRYAFWNVHTYLFNICLNSTNEFLKFLCWKRIFYATKNILDHCPCLFWQQVLWQLAHKLKKEIQMVLLFKKCQLIFITKNINLFTMYDFVHTIWNTIWNISVLSDTSVWAIITDYKGTKNVQDNKCYLVICGRIYFWQICSS